MIESGELDTWDYQWGFTRNAHRGLSCMPSVSLIRNIGFSDDATHTVGSPCKIKESELAFPLRINLILLQITHLTMNFLSLTPGLQGSGQKSTLC